jgi:ATP-dependent exoDNAse (exonuclease V) beta subunit
MSGKPWSLTAEPKLPYEFHLDKKNDKKNDNEKQKSDFDYKNIYTLADYDLQIIDITDYLGKKKYYERQRVAYVAFTRAKTKLYISSFIISDGGKSFDGPTHFFITAYLANNHLTNEKGIEELKQVFENANIESKTDEIYHWPIKDELNDKLKNIDITLENQSLEKPVDIENVKVSKVNATSYKNFVTKNEQYKKNFIRPIPYIADYFSSDATEIGNIVHERIDYFLKNKNAEITDVPGKAQKRIEQFKKYYKKHNLKEKFVSSEFQFLFPKNGVNISGTIDAIFYDKNTDKWIIIDWKTRKKVSAKKTSEESQLKIYKEFWANYKKVPIDKIITKIVYLTENSNDEKVY